MSYNAAQPFTPWRWLGVPMLQALALTIVLAIPLRLFGLRLPEPVAPLVLAFAWAVIRPSIIAPIAVLAMGLFLDLFWGTPLGLWALALLTGYGVVLVTRSMMAGQSQPMMWAWYAVTCAIAMGAAYLFSMVDARQAPNLFAVGWQLLATIVLYPFAHRLIDRFEDADVRFR
jgi:rod shape-determining protein MreD